MTNTRIDRRGMALGLAGLAALGASPARAQGHDQHQHGSTPAAPQKPLVRTAAADAMKPVIAAARECEKRGRICRAHCRRLIRKGDLSLQECLKLVNAMLPICEATASLAKQDAKRFKDLAKLCIDVCSDCAAECEKHAAHHAECKGCLEACRGMIAALKGVV